MKRKNQINILLTSILCLPLFFLCGCSIDGGGLSDRFASIGALKWFHDQSGLIVMADKGMGWIGNASMPVNYQIQTTPTPINYSFYKLDTKGKILETIFSTESGYFYGTSFFLDENGSSLLVSGYYKVTYLSLISKNHFIVDSNISASPSFLLGASPDNKLILISRLPSIGAPKMLTYFEALYDTGSRVISSTTNEFITAQWLSKNRVALLQIDSTSKQNLIVCDTLFNPIYSTPSRDVFISAIRYSPKSDELFYTENRAIKKMSLKTGAVTSITQSEESVSEFKVSSDGAFIVYRDDAKHKIKILNLRTNASAIINTPWSDDFEISPDDKKIVWISHQNSTANPFRIEDIVIP